MLRLSRTLTRLPVGTSRLVSCRPLTSVAIAQKTMWSSTNKKLAWTTLGACLITASYLGLKQPAYAEEPGYVGTVEDPATNIAFPVFLNTDNEWKRLVGLGARFVSFLKVNVYVVGMYMRGEDIGALQKLWKNFDKSEFLKDNQMATEFLDQPYDISIRIVPARNTNTQHLRDGFLRLLMQRMKDQDLTEQEERDVLQGIQEFKKNFTSMKVKKNSEFVFTKTKEGGLKMVYEDKDWGTVDNKWIAKNFLMSYLDPKAPSSEAALLDIADGLERLLK
ncbi:chalcone-flavanone isomerase-domain-containing protein [Thamnidium elegans]|uniref:Chalcone isomerase domain-containing protein n=1 Tax=Thamnidium elegans TaxID=101142 RepID=A0A8H7SKM3_9FUNG|nr:hypothetical protein INT48_000636 [Thamnidium elegans]KAI8083725.1 chalcone-flavanone isomerase-domain-containing protein [Thamnidium elegans]